MSESEQKTDYERFCEDGYTVIQNILSPNEINIIQKAITSPFQHLCKKHNIGIPDWQSWEDIHTAMLSIKSIDPSLYLAAIKLCQNHPAVLNIPSKESLINALADIGISDPVVSLKPFPIAISDQLHIEGGYNLRPLHQEWPVMQGSSDGVVCWIALHDIKDHHNALHLVPGSHKNGLRQYTRTKCGTGISKHSLPKEDPIKMNIKAGSAVIFSCFMAHGTHEIGGDLRVAVTIRFNNMAAPDFIERGYPDPSTVTINREPKNPYIPTKITRPHS